MSLHCGLCTTQVPNRFICSLFKWPRTVTGWGRSSAVSLFRDSISAPCACGCCMSVSQADRFPINFIFIWDERREHRRPMAARHQGLYSGGDWRVNTQACGLSVLDKRHREECGLYPRSRQHHLSLTHTHTHTHTHEDGCTVAFKCRWSESSWKWKHYAGLTISGRHLSINAAVALQQSASDQVIMNIYCTNWECRTLLMCLR